jgi:hypothetical protein
MNGDALGEAIGRARRVIAVMGLTQVMCSGLAYLAGWLVRDKRRVPAFALLVFAVIAAMNGGEIHWPQWAKISLPEWSQSTSPVPFQFHRPEQSTAQPAPFQFHRPEQPTAQPAPFQFHRPAAPVPGHTINRDLFKNGENYRNTGDAGWKAAG